MTTLDKVSVTEKKWYVLRDLKRPNAKVRAWQWLAEEFGLEVFTPKKWVLVMRQGRRESVAVAFIPDLLFVHDAKVVLDSIIANTETLQFRYRKYGAQNEAMVVPDADMERFIKAVGTAVNPEYYTMDMITPEMHRRRIRIAGGPLDGTEGYLLTTRGSKKKRLLVELQNFFAASVEVSPEFIQLI